MDPAATQATFCATLVDEWARAGVAHAVIAPGSRSTPMALALAGHDRLRVHVHHDERCASFIALGIGARTGVPAVLLCTSGTAATHLHGAVVEAHQAGVPMIVVTADRPPELRDVGAPQTIDQSQLYGRAVRWFHDPGVADDAIRHTWRSLASRAVLDATAPRPGPVHLNLPFREPLLGEPALLPDGRADGAPWTVRGPSGPGAVVQLGGERGVIVAGPGAPAGLAAGSWPVLTSPRSGLDGPSVIVHADALLRIGALAAELNPDVVVRIGSPPASRVVAEWLADSGAEEIVIATPWLDPGRTAAVVSASLGLALPAPTPGWLERWSSLDAAAADAIAATLAAHDEPTEPHTARTVLAALPSGAQLVVASSMPIRDLEWYARPRADVFVHANRGANGIDGVLSTAIGIALAGEEPTVALVGDIAFLHDTNALLALRQREVALTIVVVDNDGGGIFSFLPQAATIAPERFELLFGTPHGVRIEDVAAAHGITSITVDEAASLESALRESLDAGGVRVVVVRTDREANVKVHDELHRAVLAAVT